MQEPHYRLIEQLARRHGGVVTTADAAGAGISAQWLSRWSRRGALARVARGVYAVGPGPVPLDPRVVTRSMRVVLSHASAVAWLGADLPAPTRVLHVTAPRNRGRRVGEVSGVRLHRADLASDDVVVVRGAAVTSPVRTAIDVARSASLDDAVVMVDALLRARQLSVEEFRAAAERTTGTGRRRALLVASLVDPTSGSVLESMVRMLLWRHEIAPPRTQFSLTDERTGWIGYVDFAWPEAKVVLECDGFDFHSDRTTFQRDRRRWSAINRIGWRAGVVTWADVTGDPQYVVALVSDLLSIPPAPLAVAA